MTRSEPLRIGILGGARITEPALVGPAHTTGDRLVAVVARDRSRAEAFAARHGVEGAARRGRARHGVEEVVGSDPATARSTRT